MLLDAVEFASREGPQLAGNVTIAFRQRNDDAAPDQQHCYIVDCFGGKLVLYTHFEAKDVTWEVEATDLASPIAEDLVGPHRALGHLVHIFGRFAFAKNLLVGAKPHLASHRLHGPESATDRSGAGGGVRMGLIGRNGAKLGLHQHGWAPVFSMHNG